MPSTKPLFFLASCCLLLPDIALAAHNELRFTIEKVSVESLENGLTIKQMCRNFAGRDFRPLDFTLDLKQDFRVEEFDQFLDRSGVSVDPDTEVDEIAFMADNGSDKDPGNDHGYYMMKRVGANYIFHDVYPDDFFGSVWVHAYPRNYGGYGKVLCIKEGDDGKGKNDEDPNTVGDNSGGDGLDRSLPTTPPDEPEKDTPNEGDDGESNPPNDDGGSESDNPDEGDGNNTKDPENNDSKTPSEDPDPQKPVTSTPDSPTGSSYGDPHIQVWNGDIFDFHGGCDLVLFSNPSFAGGLGMTVHIRTKIRTWWSFIETAVVQIGNETLEVMGDTGASQERTNPYWINSQPGEVAKDNKLFTLRLAGYKVRYRSAGGNEQRQFKVILGHGDEVVFKTFKDFVRVNIRGKTPQNFAGSVGLMGAYPDGARMARDNATKMVDMVSFGKEWQVRLSESMLFHSLGDGVHHPTECAMPDSEEASSLKRRLSESALTVVEAQAACASVVSKREKQMCVADVLATNDKDMAGVY